MSTLESCTDALLQQKVVQASNYERLESRLMEMERAKRSLFFGLKEIITDVERRRQDFGELQEESARLQQQLQQGYVKFSALAAFMGEEQKKSIRLQDALESSTTAWTGCPARAAFLLRALQERNAFCRQMVDVVKALNRVRALVEVVQRVDAAKGLLKERLERLGAEAERLDGMLRESHKAEEMLQGELQGRTNAAQADAARVWLIFQEKERQLLALEAALAAARLSVSAGEEFNATYRMALQAALSMADACLDRRDRMAVVSTFRACPVRLGAEERRCCGDANSLTDRCLDRSCHGVGREAGMCHRAA
ncbi:BRCT domain-containing protein [Trypanosoma rangeli]|uniref:BRCT domain-containing protein n=1 Tax=Trypanosoma rangeli TaxID=5698 RepID=A0A422NFL3_TRYRA|nr:BRCT domain-containing protein [Trypanosoma rangeli]RNF04253.1 BRCT domain-containing protein [Trypanosoma rangeli]|eukprot:RNF04253.1 BRCT domain-containing protein [Trypanosoma rangeli]